MQLITVIHRETREEQQISKHGQKTLMHSLLSGFLQEGVSAHQKRIRQFLWLSDRKCGSLQVGML